MKNHDKKREKLIFASIVYPYKQPEASALLLADSIRSFAGNLSQTPIWFLVPKTEKELSIKFKEKINALNINLIPFEITNEILQFPLAGDVLASSLAETKSENQTNLLVWLGTNTIILQEPKDFLLSTDKNLGYRPVHHTNIGSLYEKPLDSFWALVYQHCHVSLDHIFPMKTHVDTNIIRPYFNSGILITRPEKRLLKGWCDTFLRVYQEPDFKKFYEQDKRYTIFIHQAILSGIILSRFLKSEIQELPNTYNYPLHLYDQDISGNRPKRIEELVTLRYEGLDLVTIKNMPASSTLKTWLTERIII